MNNFSTAPVSSVEIDAFAFQIDQNSAKSVEYSDESNVKIIHFQRHAEGHHNVAGEANYADYELEAYEDATLSDKGFQQCREAASAYESLQPQLCVVSMMRRCMETAKESFPHLVNKIKWLANEDVREQTGSHPCDRRLNTSVYRQYYPHVNFEDIKPEHEEDPLYWKYGNEIREPKGECLKRAKIFINWPL